MRTIRSAVLHSCTGHARPYAESRPLTVQDLTLAPPGPGELLVQIEAAGVCHSDLSVVAGDRPRPMPMALGHEAAGTVLETGTPDDHLFAPGDRVALAFLPLCGQCVECLSGRGFLCSAGAAANGAGQLLSGGSRLSDGAGSVHHHLGISAFATHAVVDRRSAIKLTPDVPFEVAALFGCAVLTGVGAIWNAAMVRPGESVTVVGLGGVGLAAVLGALAAGAVRVCGIDPSAEKRALALQLGASAAFAPERQGEAGQADVVIETAGKAAVLAAAVLAARRGGRIVTVGLPGPSEALSIPALHLVAESKTLIGSYMGSSIPSRDIPRFLALWREGRLPVEQLLSSRGPLGEINTLMDRLADGTAVRQLVLPGLG